MTAGALATPDLLTVRGLCRNRAVWPGGERFGEVVRWYLPLIYGSALALLPENAAAAESVSVAVFETLAFRCRKLSRRTVLATWLMRTVWYAAARERRRLGLARKPTTGSGLIAQELLKQINALKPRHANAFVLVMVLQESIETVAAALRSKPKRIEKRIAKATGKLNKRFRKIAETAARTFPTEAADITRTASPLTPTFAGPSAGRPALSPLRGEGEALAALRTIVGPVAPEVEAAVLTRIAEWKPNSSKGELVRGLISAWRWRRMRIFARRLGTTVGLMMLMGSVAFGSFIYLLQHGYLHLVFFHLYQHRMLKQFPEMAQPARAWPENPPVAFIAPARAAELYGPTNIWLAKIQMTRQQWRNLQPRYVKPLPAIVEDGEVKLRNPNASRSGLAGALGLDFPWAQASFEFGGQRFERVGVRFRGNGSYVSAFQLQKKPYKIDLNRFEKDQRLAGVTTLNFVNELTDYSYLHDVLAQQLFRELGAVAPRTAYSYLTVDVEGKHPNQPVGLYVLVENIDAQFAKDRFGAKATPIFKPVTYDLFADLGRSWSAYEAIYDLKTKATEAQRARLMDFAALVSHADDEEFAGNVAEYLDLEEYAAFLAGLVLLSSYDGYLSDGQNFYLYLDARSNKFGFIPWDQDIAWGAFSYIGTAEKREKASIWRPAAYDHRFLKRVMKVEAFRAVYRRKLEEGLAGPFTVERLNREIDRIAAVIRPAVGAESHFRLQRFETAISTNWVKGPRDGSMRDGTAIGPAAPPHQLKRFIQARAKSVRDQLDGKSEGSLIAGFGQER